MVETIISAGIGAVLKKLSDGKSVEYNDLRSLGLLNFSSRHLKKLTIKLMQYKKRNDIVKILIALDKAISNLNVVNTPGNHERDDAILLYDTLRFKLPLDIRGMLYLV